jgi:hypothetical protein
MTNPRTSRPTTSSTGPSQPLPLVTWTLETKGENCRLLVTGGPLRGVCETHSWRFTARTLTAALLDEIGAVSSHLAQAGLLSAVGIQGELAYELLEAAGDSQANLS